MGLINGVPAAASLGILWTLFGTELLITVCRILAAAPPEALRRRRCGRLALPDYFLLGALTLIFIVSAIGTYLDPRFNFSVLFSFSSGSLDQLETILKLSFATQYISNLPLYFIKGSFLTFYYPMFEHRPWRSRACFWAVSGYIAAAALATLLLQTFLCFPIRRNWDLSDFCEPFLSRPYFITITVLNTSSDLGVLFLPLFLFSRLQRIGNRERYGILFIIFLGLLSISASMVRFAVAWKAALVFELEQIKAAPTISVVLGLEIWAAYVAACLPAFRKYLRRDKLEESVAERSVSTVDFVDTGRLGG